MFLSDSKSIYLSVNQTKHYEKTTTLQLNCVVTTFYYK